jgi:hypothetical protein
MRFRAACPEDPRYTHGPFFRIVHNLQMNSSRVRCQEMEMIDVMLNPSSVILYCQCMYIIILTVHPLDILNVKVPLELVGPCIGSMPSTTIRLDKENYTSSPFLVAFFSLPFFLPFCFFC